MNLGVTLKMAEKTFGPALPGRGDHDKTLSAVRYPKGGGTKFAGITGMVEDAAFYIHFPTPVDWTLLTSKKGTPDFVNDLKPSGPQGEQGRERLVAEFLAKVGELNAKRKAKAEAAEKKNRAAEKKNRAAKRKLEAVALRGRYAHLVGEHEATIMIGAESIPLLVKITKDKSGKIKIAGAI